MAMTPEQAQAYRDKLARALAPCHPENFQHFASEEEKRRHLDEVRRLQENNEVPF